MSSTKGIAAAPKTIVQAVAPAKPPVTVASGGASDALNDTKLAAASGGLKIIHGGGAPLGAPSPTQEDLAVKQAQADLKKANETLAAAHANYDEKRKAKNAVNASPAAAAFDLAFAELESAKAGKQLALARLEVAHGKRVEAIDRAALKPIEDRIANRRDNDEEEWEGVIQIREFYLKRIQEDVQINAAAQKNADKLQKDFDLAEQKVKKLKGLKA